MSDYVKQLTDAQVSLYDLLRQLGTVDGSGTISVPRYTLIGGVKARIDELMPEGEGIQFDVDGITNTTDTLDLLINAFLDESARNVHQIAPLHVINGKIANVSPVPSLDGSGYVVVPNDYLRFISFKMTLWQREVSSEDLITPQSNRYKLQGNNHTRGGKAKPVCVFNTRIINAEPFKVIEYYSVSPDDTHTLEKFIYVASVSAEDIQANLVETMLWICAKKVLQVSGRIAESEKAWEEVKINLENLL